MLQFNNNALHVAAFVNDEGIASALALTSSKTMLDLRHKNREGLMPFETALLFNSFAAATLLVPEPLREDHALPLLPLTQGKQRDEWDEAMAQIEEEFGRIKSNDWDAPIQMRSLDPHPGQPQETSALDTVVVDFLVKEGSIMSKDIVYKFEQFKRAWIVHSQRLQD